MTNFPNVSFNQDFLKTIEKTEVLNIIRKLKDKTAAGFDKLSVKLVKLIAPYIVNPLIFILKYVCLKQSIFPDKFKILNPYIKLEIKRISPTIDLFPCFVIFQTCLKK